MEVGAGRVRGWTVQMEVGWGGRGVEANCLDGLWDIRALRMHKKSCY